MIRILNTNGVINFIKHFLLPNLRLAPFKTPITLDVAEGLQH